MDGALSFAEGMGFLFDDDMVASGGTSGRVRALKHWQELVGDDGSSAAAPLSPSVAEETQTHLPELMDEVDPGCLDLEDALGEDVLDEEDDELLLDEFVLREDDEEHEEAEASPPPAASSPPLSKFRRPDAEENQESGPDAAESAVATQGGAALGRIAIAKLRLGGNGPDRPNALTRLLGSF
jgi:hypothetical protein